MQKKMNLRFAYIAACVIITTAFSCTKERVLTPLETVSGGSVTTYDEMMVFLNDLQQKNGGFTIESLTVSVDGRDIPVLRFQQAATEEENPSGKITILVYAQQHGDEPSGKEAVIQLARDIATGEFTDFLQTADLLLVPQLNPDGAESNRRLNSNNVDLDQDHMSLSQPETSGLQQLFRSILPEVTLDIQEYETQNEKWNAAGYRKNFGIQMGVASNLNVSIVLRRFAWTNVFPALQQDLTLKNIHFQRYLEVDDPTKRFRYGTTAINNGRGSMGLYNTLAFVLNGPKGSTGTDNIRERTRRQVETVKSFLDYFSRNAEEVKRIVREERTKMIRGNIRQRIHVNMDFKKDPANPSVTVPVVLLENGEQIDNSFNNFYPLVSSSISVTRPLGYAIPPGYENIVDLLRNHEIEVQRSEEAARGVLELYTINSVTRTEIEDKEMLSVNVSMRSRISTIPEGYYIVWCNDITVAKIIVLLEPHSIWGLAQQREFLPLLNSGPSYPIIRIMRIMD
ncbi:DUF2817 domain-containing protein [candidate division KSB1 bacterium]|nr:DUF2817 domain-containing protein [candidate division KSB1 bacterium]